MRGLYRKNIRRAVWLLVVFTISSGTLLFGMVDPPEKAETASDAAEMAESDGYQAMLVEEREEAGQIRLELLRQAEEDIQLVYHTFHSGEWMKAFFGEVLAAADREVDVTILVDGVLNQMRGDMRGLPALLSDHDHIDVHYYQPPRAVRPAAWNNRLHDKLLVVDQTYVMTGGRNIGDKYFSPDDEEGVSDRDVLVEVPGNSSLMEDVSGYIDNLMRFDKTYAYREETSRYVNRKSEELEPELKRARESMQSEGTLEEGFVDVDHVSFFHNPFGEIQNEPYVWEVLAEFAHDATEEVLVQTPYLILTEPMQEILESGPMDNEQVTVLTNSIYSSPNFPAFSAYLADRDKWVESDVQVYEYAGENPIHAKTFLFDGHTSAIGSFNVDPRSAYLNTESMLVIEGEAFAGEVAEALEGIAEDSIQADAGNDWFNEVTSTWKQIVMAGFSRITTRFAHLL